MISTLPFVFPLSLWERVGVRVCWAGARTSLSLAPVVVSLCAGSLAHAGTVTTYPAPENAPLSTDYVVAVAGKPVDVYAVKSVYGVPVSFAYCDIDGPVPVSVKANFIPGKQVHSMSLHPLSMGLRGEHDGNRLRLTVEKPCSITVLVNGQHRKQALHLFLNPPAREPPKDAIVFGPGMHKMKQKGGLRLKSGQAVHIAGGAWVEGSLHARNVTNITISGRGVLYQPRDRRNVIGLSRCAEASIEGVILTRKTAPGWVSIARDCDNVTVRNMKVVVPIKPSTDGFNPCNSHNVLVEDCFFRTGDDCIAIKGNTGGPMTPAAAKRAKTRLDIDPQTQPPIENVTIRRCVFWSEFNNVVCIGAETRAKHFDTIRIEDCDVLFHPRYWRGYGSFSILPLHGTELRNIVFENIRIEHIEGPLFSIKFGESLYGSGIPGFHRFPGGISNVTIKDIYVGRQLGGSRSSFAGLSKDKQVRNVTIQGVRYGDTLVTDAASMGLRCNEHVTGVRFLDKPAGSSTQRGYAAPDPKVGKLWLTFASGFNPRAQDTDGVRLRVEAWQAYAGPRHDGAKHSAGGRTSSAAAAGDGQREEQDRSETLTLLDTHVLPQNAWQEHAVNLSPLAGKKTVIRFVVDPGPDTRFDWFQWGAPRIIRLTEEGHTVVQDTKALFEGAQRGVLGWPQGQRLPLAHGAVARLHAAEDRKNWLTVGKVAKPGVFFHPAWQDGQRRPVFIEWSIDLPKE